MPVMSGKRAFLDLLKQEGVGIMFGNPGTTELPLMDAFAVENDIRYILGLQEAALMAMGAVLFRSTGIHPDGSKFVRNGRSTCTFMRTAIGAPWICTHSHLSVTPGTPYTSHGRRQPKS